MTLNKIDMTEATRLTRLGRLTEAMAVLKGQAVRATRPDGSAFFRALSNFDARNLPKAGAHLPGFAPRTLKEINPLGADAGPEALERRMPVTPGGRFEKAAYANAFGSRPYKLYVPSIRREEASPLIVMLHGCTQSPDDFAAGTMMNDVAEEQGFLVAYPEQVKTANTSKCWNWFNDRDQQRDMGEPSLIAGITRQVMENFAIDVSRIYVAGLSAGGAAAAIMGATYPDIYAAIGVHSGLVCGAAHNVASAFTAMAQGGAPTLRPSARGGFVPTIVFHGDQDRTVSRINGDQVIDQAQVGARLRADITYGRSQGGLDYTQTVYRNVEEAALLEHWLIHGGGHAWSGGSSAGSYTDPRGPDASREMVRFFLTHRSKTS